MFQTPIFHQIPPIIIFRLSQYCCFPICTISYVSFLLHLLYTAGPKGHQVSPAYSKLLDRKEESAAYSDSAQNFNRNYTLLVNHMPSLLSGDFSCFPCPHPRYSD